MTSQMVDDQAKAIDALKAKYPRRNPGGVLIDYNSADIQDAIDEAVSISRASQGSGDGTEGDIEREPAPKHGLPDHAECALRVSNSDFIEKRVAEGGYGPEPDSLLASDLHRFIYEYDDADPYRSSWFMHRLELVVQEVRAAAIAALSPPVTPQAAILAKLWAVAHLAWHAMTDSTDDGTDGIHVMRSSAVDLNKALDDLCGEDGDIHDVMPSLVETDTPQTPTERKPFKMEVSQEWCERMALLEEGEVSAGVMHPEAPAATPQAPEDVRDRAIEIGASALRGTEHWSRIAKSTAVVDAIDEVHLLATPVTVTEAECQEILEALGVDEVDGVSFKGFDLALEMRRVLGRHRIQIEGKS